MEEANGCKNIVAYHGNFLSKRPSGDQNWIVMEFCGCGSLGGYLKKQNAPFKEEEIAALCKGILNGLYFLHNHRIIHRDIKSANVLWNEEGMIKVADLGEALRLPDGTEEADEMRGSPYWMAPELARGEMYTTNVDIWSFGVTCIELADMEPPLIGLNPMRALLAIGTMTDSPTLPNKSFSKNFQDFIAKCLDLDQKKRWTAEQLLQHPFVKNADEKILSSLARDYFHPMTPVPDLLSNADLMKSSASTRALVGIRDENTDENLDEFRESLLAWKMNNEAIIHTMTHPIRNKTPTLRIFRSSASELDAKMDQWSALLHLAFKASSTAFGVISSDRVTSQGAFRDCFIGKQLIDWIYENLYLEQRQEAIELGTQLLMFKGADLIIPVSSSEYRDLDTDAMYRWNHNKIQLWNGSQVEKSIVRSNSDNPPRSESPDGTPPGFNAGRRSSLRSPVDLLRTSTRRRPSVLDSPRVTRNESNRDSLRTSSGKAEKSSEDDKKSEDSNSPGPSPKSTRDAVEEAIKSHAASGLTERDWALILSGSIAQEYMIGEIIVKQGDENSCLFRIKSGTAVVEKEEEGVTKTLATMGERSMFGEMSVLTQHGKVSATIRAQTRVALYKIEATFMYQLFSSEPGIKKRFFRSAAIRLAGRLRELGQAKKPQVEKQNKPQEPQQQTASDKKFSEIFGLPESEVVIKEYTCWVKGLVKEHGTLYVTQQFVCFLAKVFGKKTKIIVPIVNIEKFNLPKKRQFQLSFKKRLITFHDLLDPEAVYNLILGLYKSQKQRPSASPKITATQKGKEILSSEDWQILLRGSKCKNYFKDDVIVKEGAQASALFQIGRGSCTVSKVIDDKPVVLGTMTAGEIFGEISFLEGGKVSATIAVAEVNTEVYEIEASALLALFFRQPALAGRFFQYLASVLSKRLHEREQAHLQNTKK
eukprot:TRINITY_DN3038_c0_g1_i1.p1 TRINITY_DN3038_c0_g1~~TRINITY_DN3038_c0_g1_i1.p1  ORF type:complete len:1023 (+),score=338.35 TRINITY_DN3038_c0_g1_i1:277-3069(+)